MNSKKAIVTILGKAGEQDNHTKAKYYFEWKKEVQKEYFNTFPLLIENFSKSYEIVPIFTKDAKSANIKVLKKENLELKDREWICENCGEKHDRDFLAARNIKMFGFRKYEAGQVSATIELQEPPQL